MRVTIAAIGKLKDLERDLVERYAARFDGAGRRLALGPLKIVELPESRAAVAPDRKADEARRLLQAVSASEHRIALDEHAPQLGSEPFAMSLAHLRDGGTQHVAFLIGGPDGHDPALLAGAHARLSLGAMTLPHGLARIILAEQLYRAASILSGHPYHRA